MKRQRNIQHIRFDKYSMLNSIEFRFYLPLNQFSRCLLSQSMRTSNPNHLDSIIFILWDLRAQCTIALYSDHETCLCSAGYWDEVQNGSLWLYWIHVFVFISPEFPLEQRELDMWIWSHRQGVHPSRSTPHCKVWCNHGGINDRFWFPTPPTPSL